MSVSALAIALLVAVDARSETNTTHWSFIKPVRVEPPAAKDAHWPRNPIDQFVLARLEKEGIKPSPQAARATLLRRVALDLTGLPPSPAELDQFLSDNSADAYEKQVDRLLASPHFGERWGKHWLDQARYADSNGYSIDAARSIWKYRDWVINAINQDMPFDQFVIEQLAGDMLPNASVDQKIATGFHRNTMINQEGGIDPEQFRIESILDRVNTTGTVFLGLTVGCAQCHNHKFDPIAQREYYQFFAFFNNQDEPTLRVGANGSPLDKQIADVQAKLEQAEAAEAGGADENAAAEVKKLKAQLTTLTRRQGMAGVTTLVMAERKEPRPSFVFIKGDFTRHGDPVSPAVPAVLPPMKAADPAQPNRLDLAHWIVDPANPLTARVTVNRIWMQYFGRGIVETENDFGTQGSLPSHPELLDWLATELIRQKWSTKAIHRLIVTSATYRQSSDVRPELTTIDPYNRLLARQTRVRLDAEIVRDVALTASGLLTDKIGGPSVYPPQPAGVTNLGQVKHDWKTSTGPDRYRRGLYTFLWRGTPHPLLTNFDATDATSTCTRRMRSNTPLQALTLLNDEAFMEFAQALAARVLKEGPADNAGRVDYAFRLCLTRTPDADEREILLKLLDEQTATFAKDAAEAKSVSGNYCPATISAEGFAPWVIAARTVLNVDEVITRE
ncbi:MAG TPA: DUF1549 and DUF1553 domain-containing protein [Humisphaera sp.]|nr:DUF1549 and DUF1553 domain-containing protein [Humisphaera sp.]